MAQKAGVGLANTLVDLSWKISLIQVEQHPGLLVIEFPEDLGAIAYGKYQGVRPASIWQFDEFSKLLQCSGVRTVGIHQSDFEAEYLKPTRITIRGDLAEGKVFYEGPPIFDGEGYYLGPIPRKSAQAEGLIGLARRPGDTSFRTSGTAAWPPELCRWLADSLDNSYNALDYLPSQGGIFTSTEPSGDTFTGTADLGPAPKEEHDVFPITNPVVNHWIGGRGKPRQCYALGKTYDYHDGCGLTSPGRWDKERRVFPKGRAWKDLRDGLYNILAAGKLSDGSTVGSAGIQKILLQLACTPKTDVFQASWIQEARVFIKSWLAGRCGDFKPEVEDVAENQPFCLYMMHFLLREMRDPDFELLDTLRTGVTAGILFPLPRTPALFEEQVKWRLRVDPLVSGCREAENYGSLADHIEEVEAQFREEEKIGAMKEFRDEVLAAEYGRNVAVSPLAVLIESPGKMRVLHDGTHKTRVNHLVKCRDKLRSPGVREKHVQLRSNRSKNQIPISILADFSRAHRLVKIIQAEWAMLSCKLRPGSTWVNCVGTFGISSAAYWWARLAGALMRLIFGILGEDWPMEALLFADDVDFEAADERERTAVVLSIFLMLVFGAPMKNAKFRGGFRVQWIGLFFDNKNYSLGLSPSRAKWLVEWIKEKLKDGRVSTREMAGGLGRLNFAATALYHERAWLGPLYSWVSAIIRAEKAVVDIPWGIRLFLHWIASRLEGGCELMAAPEIPTEEGDMFRSDAKAEAGRAFVGGWETRFSKDTKKCKWYYFELTAEEAPWVFSKENDPGRVIAALELLGTILCIILFDIRSDKHMRGGCSVTGLTDNQSNSFAVIKGMSTKYPLAPLLIELSEQMRHRSLDLRLTWVSRNDNVEADAITNQDFTLFDSELRVPVKYSDIKWLALDRVLDASKEIFDKVVAQREERKLLKEGSTSFSFKGNKFKSGLKRSAPW
jgi:hypothetical protein